MYIGRNMIVFFVNLAFWSQSATVLILTSPSLSVWFSIRKETSCDKLISISPGSLSVRPASHCAIISMFLSLHSLWSRDVSAARLPSRAFGFPDWIRGIFQPCPAVQNMAAHTNTFQSLDGPDTHSLTHKHLFCTPQIWHIYTNNISSDRNLCALCVMLRGLTALLSVAVCFFALHWPRF